jgi:hypothetical protein
MSVMGFFRRRDFVSRSGRKSAALSNCHDALTAALELLPRRRVRANDRFRGPEELFMRHEFVTRAATIVVGAGLMLGGCATREDVERAQASADAAHQQAAAAMAAAQQAQGTANQALSTAQSAATTAQAAQAAAAQMGARHEEWKAEHHARHHRHRHGQRG